MPPHPDEPTGDPTDTADRGPRVAGRGPSGLHWLDGTAPAATSPGPGALDVRTRTEVPGRIVVALAGELDMATITRADRTLQDLLGAAAPDTQVVVDLADLTFIDSRGVVTLITAAAGARARRVHLRVVGCRPARATRTRPHEHQRDPHRRAGAPSGRARSAGTGGG